MGSFSRRRPTVKVCNDCGFFFKTTNSTVSLWRVRPRSIKYVYSKLIIDISFKKLSNASTGVLRVNSSDVSSVRLAPRLYLMNNKAKLTFSFKPNMCYLFTNKFKQSYEPPITESLLSFFGHALWRKLVDTTYVTTFLKKAFTGNRT